MASKQNTIIYSRRKELGLTIEEIAKQLGVNKSTVSRWESGETANMRRDKIEKMAEILHISPLQILGMSTKAKEAQPLSAREFMRIICQGDQQALAIVERLKLTDNGELEITGADLASQAVLNHQIKGVISALKNARLTDEGMMQFEYSPDKNRKE